MTISAFVIDCDGTLVDTESLWSIAKRATTERWGGVWSEALRTALLGTPLHTCAQLIAAQVHHPQDIDSIAHNLTSSFREVLASMPVNACPGAEDLLLALAARSIPVAVASNGQLIDVETALERAGLRSLVASVHCPNGALRPKPDPDLYLAACRALGAAPSHSIAIEDAPLGVLSAQRAGLLTLGLVTEGAPALSADYELPALWPLSFPELERMLEAHQAR